MIHKTTSKLKNKKGFSLVELMVVVTIAGILTGIAIPTFNEYRKSSQTTVYKTDLTSLHKGWLAFGTERSNFCRRRTKPREASIAYVGMESLFESKFYGNRVGTHNFIGFGSHDSDNLDCLSRANDVNGVIVYTREQKRQLNPIYSRPEIPNLWRKAITIGLAWSLFAEECELSKDKYVMGVFGRLKKGEFTGLSITHNSLVKETKKETAGDISDEVCDP